MGSAVMMHGGDRSVDNDPGKCFARYWEERYAAVVRACQGISFPFPEWKDYSFAPIFRDLLRWPNVVEDFGEPRHDSLASIL